MSVVAAVLLTPAAQAQQIAVPDAARTVPLAATLPVDPDVKIGRFDNGLQYYIRANKEPEERAELRLVVNAGSILEDDDQQGLAHFVEHMAFNGTKHFPKQELVSFMESIGMRFGPSVNAYTSFDETVYMLQVPTDRPGVMEKAFQILQDWAQHVTFEPEEVDKERGVILEEWRLGRGASARMMDRQFPILLKDSRYAQRLPIGKPEVLQRFRHERLRQFYADWYRPDLMAVIAVGDFDPAAIEALIKQQFGGLPKAAAPRARAVSPVPDHPGTLYAVATDKEATSTSLTVYSKMALRDPTTVGAYRQQLVEGVFGGLLSLRFAELAQKPDAPFLGASAVRGQFVRTKEASMLNALVKDDGLERGLQALFTETERVARHGFTKTELERQKTNMLRSFERMVAEKNNRQSSSLAGEYVRAFTTREPIPGLLYEAELAKRFVPEITLEEVNALAREWAPDGNRVVVISAPEKDSVAIPDETKLAAVIKQVEKAEIAPYADTVGSATLLDSLPEPGTVTSATAKPEFGIIEWQLSNGVRVVLKPTTHKDDEILFQAFSPGGMSLASDEDYIAALTATLVVGQGGLGKFRAIELPKVLAGKVASVQPYIQGEDEGLSGSAAKKDLETMFQLLHLWFTQPRRDEEQFGVITSQMRAMYANQANQPAFALVQLRAEALYQNHVRTRPFTAERVDEMNLDKSFAFFRDRFADAGDFTFVFVGTFTPEEIRPLVERYVASLPSTGRKETWKDVGIRIPRGVIDRRVQKGIEPKSQTMIVFSGPFAYNQDQRVAMRALAMVLETRLREILREDLGGTYSVGVSPSYTKVPREEYSLTVSFGSGPDRADALAARVLEEITKLRNEGPTEKQVNDVREAMTREYQTNMQQNGYLVGQLAAKYQINEPLDSLFALTPYIDKLSVASLQTAARTYLDLENYVKLALFPEK
jgi:zinc protease